MKREYRGHWLDNAIGFLSPLAKAKRIRARVMLDLIETELSKRKYEGASAGRRTAGWTAGSTSANTEIGASLGSLRNRSRDLVRNNQYAKRGIEVIRKNVVGKGVITQAKSVNKARAKTYDQLWKAWATEPSIDFDGRNDIYGLQELIIGTVAESGECLVRLRRAKTSDGLAVPIQLQVLECDFLDSSVITATAGNGNKIIQGIEFDRSGRRVAYHLFEEHPGEISLKGSFKSNRIPANEILHVYDITRPGQVRGVPWLSAAIIKLRDLDGYEDAQLVRQKIAACFSAFVYDAEIPQDVTSDDARQKLGEKVEPGIIEILPPGKKVEFANPPGVTGYKEYTSTLLMSIASSLGVTYEAFTGDLSQVNFSSARMGWLEFQRNVDAWRSKILLSLFMKPVFRWFLEASELIGKNPQGVTPAFTAQKREMIDPTKEIPAMKTAVRSGFMTLREAIKMHGNDPTEHLEDMAEDNAQLDKLGLKLDSDARNPDGKGSANNSEAKKDDEKD